MRKPPILLVLLLAALAVLPPVVHARAISVVQTATAAQADDAVLTFAGATSASNVVVAGYRLSAEAQTVDVSGVTETVLHVTEFGGGTFEMGIVCFVGGSTSYTFTSSTTGQVTIAALEVSGTNGCTEDGTSDSNQATTASSPLALDAPVSVSAGSLVFGVIGAGNDVNFSCTDGYTCLPADGTDVSDRILAQYVISGGGSHDLQFTWTGTESALLVGAGIAAAGGAAVTCLRMMMGMGRC